MRKNSERKVWSLSAAQESKACVSSASPVFVLFCFSVFSFYFVVFLKKQAILGVLTPTPPPPSPPPPASVRYERGRKSLKYLRLK